MNREKEAAVLSVRDALIKWYQREKRRLPWREEVSPYRVWISEVMLQQTRVEAVIPYFHRFLKALPDLDALAKVDDDFLRKLWQGLGYYNRAANLKKAAVLAKERYGGLPSDYESLLSLPGFGEYTAGAVASIAFGQPVPAVDGNVIRVLSRFFADEENSASSAFRKKYRRLLLETIPHDVPGAFNQALMELGATVCIPNGAPHCDCCPLKEGCLGRETPLSYPVKPEKKEKTTESYLVLLYYNRKGQLLIRRRPEKGLLASLWGFPMVPGDTPLAFLESWSEENGKPASFRGILCRHRHIFTHKIWEMSGVLMELKEDGAGENEVLANFSDIQTGYPVPSAFAPFLKETESFFVHKKFTI